MIVITKRRFTAMLVAFLLLASAGGGAIVIEHQNAVDGRKALAQSTQKNLESANREAAAASQVATALAQNTYNVLIEGCNSGNTLRRTLQSIILSPAGKAQAQTLVKEGRISQADLNRSLALAKQESARVAPRSCKDAYAALKPKG